MVSLQWQQRMYFNAICVTYVMTSHHPQRRVLFDAIYAIALPFALLLFVLFRPMQYCTFLRFVAL